MLIINITDTKDQILLQQNEKSLFSNIYSKLKQAGTAPTSPHVQSMLQATTGDLN